MVTENKTAEASLESLHRIFTVPEAPDSTLGKIEQEISQNLNRFLQNHITNSMIYCKVVLFQVRQKI